MSDGVCVGNESVSSADSSEAWAEGRRRGEIWDAWGPSNFDAGRRQNVGFAQRYGRIANKPQQANGLVA